jgi:hypothetical protein
MKKDIQNLTMTRKPKKLYVENVNLTANYYREYAGFTLTEKLPRTNFMNSATMNFHNNVLLLEKAENVNHISKSEIVFQLCFDNLKLKELYDNYKQKVKIYRVSFTINNLVKEFSIIDCNGNIISFQSN